MKNMKTLLALVVALVLCLGTVVASACTAIYVGSELTADGSTMFARSEDISNSYNKVFCGAPAGLHKAGDVYQGCYGFTYTFTKDSYSYTAFSDDNLSGFCPDCGGTHAHTPYEAGGTNEMGLRVSATETLSGGIVYRSIGYVALQNRNVFKPGSGSYDYVWEIIHHVYGDQYDADYKG